MTSSHRGPSSRLATALLCAVCLLGVAPRSAHGADDPKRQARAAMTRGSALFQQGDYEGALRAFNEAQTLYPSPKIYFNMGQTYRKMDRVAEAVEAFERFLKEAPDAAPARRKDAEKFLNELRPRLAALRAAEAAAAVTADAPPAPPEAPPVAPPTPPPPAPPVAQAPAPVAQPPALAAAPKLTLDTPRPSPSPPPALESSGGVPPVDRAPPPERRWWPWVIAGVVVAGGIAAALLITRDGPLPTGSLGNADERKH